MLLVERPNVERRLESAGLYVRSHLDERLTLEDLARIAGLSPFHFHRLFRVAFGENPSAYIVRHRLRRAAHELRYGERSITEIGLRCGYESPSAFGRAFARAFALTPTAYRAAREDVPREPVRNAPSPATFTELRIETYPARDALALRHVGSYEAVGAVLERMHRIAVRRNFRPPGQLLGVSYDSPDLEEHDALRFDACVTLAAHGDLSGARADGARVVTIPGGRHASFRQRGPYERITHTFDALVSAWVLSGRVELREAPFIVTYESDPSRVAASELECDLAIPIR